MEIDIQSETCSVKKYILELSFTKFSEFVQTIAFVIIHVTDSIISCRSLTYTFTAIAVTTNFSEIICSKSKH